jgi:hypothetical protein
MFHEIKALKGSKKDITLSERMSYSQDDLSRKGQEGRKSA